MYTLTKILLLKFKKLIKSRFLGLQGGDFIHYTHKLLDPKMYFIWP